MLGHTLIHPKKVQLKYVVLCRASSVQMSSTFVEFYLFLYGQFWHFLQQNLQATILLCCDSQRDKNCGI